MVSLNRSMLSAVVNIIFLFFVHDCLRARVLVHGAFNHRNVVHGGSTQHQTITLTGQVGVMGLVYSNIENGESLTVYPQSGGADNQRLILACSRKFGVETGGAFAVESVNGVGVNVIVASNGSMNIYGDVSVANPSALLFLNAPFDENWNIDSNPNLENLSLAHSRGKVDAVSGGAVANFMNTNHTTSFSGNVYMTQNVDRVMQEEAVETVEVESPPLNATPTPHSPANISISPAAVADLVLEEADDPPPPPVLPRPDVSSVQDLAGAEVSFFDEIEFESHGEEHEQKAIARQSVKRRI